MSRGVNEYEPPAVVVAETEPGARRTTTSVHRMDRMKVRSPLRHKLPAVCEMGHRPHNI